MAIKDQWIRERNMRKLEEWQKQFGHILPSDSFCATVEQLSERRQPQVGIGVIILKQNRYVLMGKRICKHANGYHAFPGGHLEMFESFEQCAVREVMEECGIDISKGNPRYWKTVNTFYREEGKHYVGIFVVVDWHPEMGEPQNLEPDKNEGWKWYEWDELPQPQMPCNDDIFKNNWKPFYESHHPFCNYFSKSPIGCAQCDRLRSKYGNGDPEQIIATHFPDAIKRT